MVSRNKKPLPLGEAGARSAPGEGHKAGIIPYKVITLNSWEEYLSIISDSPYQNWAFRGQRDASAPLFSALSRYFMAFQLDQRAWPEQEKRILRIFKRKAIHFLQHVPDRDDDFQWLALMQDHGAPTRLLDFSPCRARLMKEASGRAIRSRSKNSKLSISKNRAVFENISFPAPDRLSGWESLTR